RNCEGVRLRATVGGEVPLRSERSGRVGAEGGRLPRRQIQEGASEGLSVLVDLPRAAPADPSAADISPGERRARTARDLSRARRAGRGGDEIRGNLQLTATSRACGLQDIRRYTPCSALATNPSRSYSCLAGLKISTWIVTGTFRSEASAKSLLSKVVPIPRRRCSGRRAMSIKRISSAARSTQNRPAGAPFTSMIERSASL